MEIGSIIKKYRTLEHITQEEMAQALSVTPQAVSRWETGLSYPDIAMIPEIVKYLGVSADRLLGCEEPEDATEKAKGEAKEVLNQSQIDSIFDYIPNPDQMSKTVLIVDDANFMRMMLQDMLSHDGHKVLQAENGEEGLEILQKHPVDVCILDIRMPGIDGIETLRIIRKTYPELKVIMLSALCTREIVKKALELGAHAFVAKPFQPSSLLERI